MRRVYCIPPYVALLLLTSLLHLKKIEDPCLQCIIVDDFNTCLPKRDIRSFSLESIKTPNIFTILPIDPTHNFPNSSLSLLKLLIVSSFNHVGKHGQCAANAFSCHD